MRAKKAAVQICTLKKERKREIRHSLKPGSKWLDSSIALLDSWPLVVLLAALALAGTPHVVDKVQGKFFTTREYPTLWAPIAAARPAEDAGESSAG